MTGRAQRFGDNINTNYIIAAQHKAASLDINISEMAKHTLEDIDPDFAHRVRPGDVVVAGRNFGCGSSREAAVHVLKALEVRAVLATSFARIYFRNAVNSGLTVLECDTSGIEQDDEIDIDLVRGVAVNLTRDQELPVTPCQRSCKQFWPPAGWPPISVSTATLSFHRRTPKHSNHLPILEMPHEYPSRLP